MENEKNEKDIITNPNVDKVNYIEVINDLKANTVSVDQYNELVEQNKQLLDSLVAGQQVEIEEKVMTPEERENRKNELRESLYTENVRDLSNLDFWKNTLELRDLVIESGDPDPFLPVGDRVPITQFDIDGAERLAEGVKHCIKYANGDSALFTQELQRITTSR